MNDDLPNALENHDYTRNYNVLANIEVQMTLTNRDAAIVLGMVARGDKRHDIAAWFGENQARIAEIEQGSHGSISAAPAADLPPKGAPGVKGRRMRAFAQKALEALDAGDIEAAKKALQDGIARYDRHEA